MKRPPFSSVSEIGNGHEAADPTLPDTTLTKAPGTPASSQYEAIWYVVASLEKVTIV